MKYLFSFLLTAGYLLINALNPQRPQVWRSPEELVEIGFKRSRVVMMNEAHSGLQRCIRTRKIGQMILPTAHRLGVRYLAMEALWPPLAEEANRTRRLPEIGSSYLSQPEMRVFIQAALDLGWKLIPYEAERLQAPANLSEQDHTNWREEQQAHNLISALHELPANAKLLVWCGNGHHTKSVIQDWVPMGYQFKQLSGIDPFVIDQTVTVNFSGQSPDPQSLSDELVAKLSTLGGTAGFLIDEAPNPYRDHPGTDAILVSTQNELE